MSVIAKFQVNSIEAFGGGSATVKMQPVVAPTKDERTDQNAEDEKFWQATPSGQILLHITNPPALEQFQPGDKFYCTFERVPEDAS